MTPRDRPLRPRRGAALLTALVGLVVIALMISGAFFSSTQEFRGGRNQLVEQRAFAVAEYGLNSEVSNWDRARNLPGGMAVGAIDSSRVYVAAGDTARVRITRLTDKSYWVVSEGMASIGNTALESKRATSAYVRLAYPAIAPRGAITTAGNISIGGSAQVFGTNTSPTGWSQCSSLGGPSQVPALAVGPNATVSLGGNGNGNGNGGTSYPGGGANTVLNTTSGSKSFVTGDTVLVRTSAAVDSNTYVRFGTETWNSLVANADVTLSSNVINGIAPVGTATTCDRTSTSNWGEPYRSGNGLVVGCYGYFPIIYVTGSTTINANGRGQGILLVNGDLTMNGNFEWFGMIIVRDDIVTGSGNSKIMGAVYSRNINLSDQSVVNGNPDVIYSSCAVESSLRGSSILVRVKERHWAQLQ